MSAITIFTSKINNNNNALVICATYGYTPYNS